MATMKIKDTEYEVYETDLDQSKLKFYIDNPRIYSVVNVDESEPTQEEIERVLCSLEHVKELKASIIQFNGLADPIIVRDKTFDVLEGNSRLAAYRILNRMEPNGKWAKIKCKVLPADISEESIRRLLGTLHLVGRTDWDPYEQAGYLYRIKKSSEKSEDEIADEMGLKRADVKSYIETYSMMKENNDLKSSHWSYYFEYLKSMAINKKRQENEGLDDAFVANVKGNRIKAAIDVRNVFGKALKVKDKVTDKSIKKFIDGEYDIYDVHEAVEFTGKTDDIYKCLNKFRNKIVDKSFADAIVEKADANIKFELKKIDAQVKRLRDKID